MLNCVKKDIPEQFSSLENEDDCLGVVVSRYLTTYLDEHKDNLPVGKLHALVMNEVEKSLLKETLSLTDGNQKKAAEILGINRNTLRKKMVSDV